MYRRMQDARTQAEKGEKIIPVRIFVFPVFRLRICV
jgi:hypothetical protein